MDLLRKCNTAYPSTSYYFERNTVLLPDLLDAFSIFLAAVNEFTIWRCTYRSHRPRIWVFNEILCLKLSRDCIYKHLDLTKETIILKDELSLPSIPSIYLRICALEKLNLQLIKSGPFVSCISVSKNEND